MDTTRYKAVFFDFDDTLGDREQYAYDCARDMLKENTQIDDPIQFEAVLQDWMLWDEKGNVEKDYVRRRLEEKYGITFPYDFDVHWIENLWRYCVAYPDAKETLTYLKKKYQLGIITNGPSFGQRKKLEVSGLDEFFDLDKVVVSGDYPYQKPDPRLFQEGCRRLDVKPEESIYVGDIFANDVYGSQQAGMTPIWIWTQGVRKQCTDVVTIHRLSELIDIL